MARSLLIALMAVLAVAGPAAAQGLPLPAVPAGVDESIEAQAVQIACSSTVCDVGDTPGCTWYTVDLQLESWPPVLVRQNIRHCLIAYIYEVIPPTSIDWVAASPTEADDAFADPAEPVDP